MRYEEKVLCEVYSETHDKLMTAKLVDFYDCSIKSLVIEEGDHHLKCFEMAKKILNKKGLNVLEKARLSGSSGVYYDVIREE
jgi:hypothetical protein